MRIMRVKHLILATTENTAIHMRTQGNRMEIGWLRMRDAPNNVARLRCLFYG